MNGLTNATSQDVAWCPKHQTAKWCCWFDGHFLARLGSQKTWVFISLHRLQIRHSKILLILAQPLPIGYFTFIIFLFFWFLTGWIRGALCVATRLYILYVAADESTSGWEFYCLIPKSPQFHVARHWSGRQGLNPRPCHTKDTKMILVISLLHTYVYKIHIKG